MAGWPAAGLMLALSMAAGCGSRQSDAPTPSQQQALDRADAIATQSGGDWDKITPGDRQYLTKTVGYGNDASARQFIAGLAHHLSQASAPLSSGPRRASTN